MRMGYGLLVRTRDLDSFIALMRSRRICGPPTFSKSLVFMPDIEIVNIRVIPCASMEAGSSAQCLVGVHERHGLQQRLTQPHDAQVVGSVLVPLHGLLQCRDLHGKWLDGYW